MNIIAGGATTKLPREFSRDFHSHAEWKEFGEEYSAVFSDGDYRRQFVEHVLSSGLREPITGAMIEGAAIERGTDLRESLSFRGIRSRHRAVMRTIEQFVYMSDVQSLRIFAPEAVTPVALRMRGVFPKFLGSEYAADPVKRRAMYPITHQDLTALTLPSDTFDLVMTNEVLEHVPDIDKALAETARVLKPGCWHVGTHPMACSQYASIPRARMDGDRVIHLVEPEYHGDPFSDQGSLVFELPGWDILDRARAAGFSVAMMRFFVSQYHGIITDDTTGVLILCCRK